MKHTLRFRAENKDIFNAVVTGKKKIETRAATERYNSISTGDVVVLVCGPKKIEKKVRLAKIYKTIGALLKKYSPRQINPMCATAKETRDMYYSFPGYKEKIKKFGIIALELK